MSDDPVLAEMLAASQRSPEVLALRVRVIELLAERGMHAEALGHCGAALTLAPGDARVLELLRACTAALAGADPTSGSTTSRDRADPSSESAPPRDGAAPASGTTSRDGAGPPESTTPGNGAARSSDATSPRETPNVPEVSQPVNPTGGERDSASADEYDWAAAEHQVADIVAPAFADAPPGQFAASSDTGLFSRSTVTLADVGGMDEVKRQLELALLGPLRNPGLAEVFGTSARGGLLLYGPPGCGKTFLASAVAGELGANFYPVEIADVLDIYVGASERNLHSVFDVARRNAPCVLFLDEVDALGHKRSRMSGSSAMRTVVNQLLTEMDSVSGDNEGVYVLGATNHPWDVDVALRRPGRFDRMVLVALPDPTARAAILRYHLRERPVAGIDVAALVARTEGFSGADLAHLCTSATQLAMAETLRTGTVRPVGMPDLESALAQVRPSTGAWLESARNVVEFANGDGSYDELARYLKRGKRR